MRWIVVSVVLCLHLVCSAAGVSAVSLDDILLHLDESTDMQNERMQFQQHIHMRVLFFSWQFTAHVTKHGDSLVIDVGEGAPSFVPDDMSAALIDVQSSMGQFALTLIGEETVGDKLYYVVEGHRKVAGQHGAQSGKLWIDAEQWHIAKANVAYTWGRLEIEQEYRTEQGRRVLHRQSAVARPIGARIEVDYGQYWFDEGESDIL